jgi:hypothetical protein
MPWAPTERPSELVKFTAAADLGRETSSAITAATSGWLQRAGGKPDVR